MIVLKLMLSTSSLVTRDGEGVGVYVGIITSDDVGSSWLEVSNAKLAWTLCEHKTKKIFNVLLSTLTCYG